MYFKLLQDCASLRISWNWAFSPSFLSTVLRYHAAGSQSACILHASTVLQDSSKLFPKHDAFASCSCDFSKRLKRLSSLSSLSSLTSSIKPLPPFFEDTVYSPQTIYQYRSLICKSCMSYLGSTEHERHM